MGKLSARLGILGVRLLTLELVGHHVGHHVPMVVVGGELDLVPEAGRAFLKVLRLGRKRMNRRRSARSPGPAGPAAARPGGPTGGWSEKPAEGQWYARQGAGGILA